MKKLIQHILLTSMCLAVAAPLAAQSVSIGQTSYGSIADAITAASDGDVIEISGVVTESISIPDKSITLRGTDPTVDIIQAAADPGVASGRVVDIFAEGLELNITIENLGIRHGNDADNGGGITIDKVTGLVTLRNVIVSDNATASNGGGISMAGSNVDMFDVTVSNNTSALEGGGLLMAPNNGVTINSNYNLYNTTIDSNTGRNGGGIHINGNRDFGDNNAIDVYMENTTVSNNSTTSGGGGLGGGGILVRGVAWVGNTGSNTSLSMVHCTVYNNSHASLLKDGIQFVTPNGGPTNFSMFNSIVVSGDDIAEKALNFANTNTTAVVNCLLGGLNAVPALVNDEANNNTPGRTATFVGLGGALADEGGNVPVLPLAEGGAAIDWCTVGVPVTLPTEDARLQVRDATPDAGAYEYVAVNVPPTVSTPVADQVANVGFGTTTLDLSTTFADANEDILDITAESSATGVVTVGVDGTTLTVTEVAAGVSTITVTANDGNGGAVSDDFTFTVNNQPTAGSTLDNVELQSGFLTSTVDLSGIFSDVDGDDITITASIDNAGVAAVDVTGTTLTITEVGTGSTTVTVTAADGKGGEASITFTLTVGDNNAPTVAAAIDDVTVGDGFGTTTVDLTDVFTDQDGDNLTYSATSSDEAVVTVEANGVTLTITEVGLGSSTVAVTANDGNGGTVVDEFLVTVEDVVGGLVGEQAFSLYPVPTRSVLHVQTDAEVRSAAVVSMDGRRQSVRVESLSGTYTLDVAQLRAGTYVLILTTDQDTYQQRFIKAGTAVSY